MVNHPDRSRSYSVYLVRSINDRIAVEDLADSMTREQAMAAAKKSAGRNPEFRNYGPTSIAYVGNGLTAVVSW